MEGFRALAPRLRPLELDFQEERAGAIFGRHWMLDAFGRGSAGRMHGHSWPSNMFRGPWSLLFGSAPIFRAGLRRRGSEPGACKAPAQRLLFLDQSVDAILHYPLVRHHHLN